MLRRCSREQAVQYHRVPSRSTDDVQASSATPLPGVPHQAHVRTGSAALPPSAASGPALTNRTVRRERRSPGRDGPGLRGSSALRLVGEREQRAGTGTGPLGPSLGTAGGEQASGLPVARRLLAPRLHMRAGQVFMEELHLGAPVQGVPVGAAAGHDGRLVIDGDGEGCGQRLDQPDAANGDAAA